MARTTVAFAAARREAVKQAAIRGDNTLKMISFDLKISKTHIHHILAAAGFRQMLVSPEERALIVSNRANIQK